MIRIDPRNPKAVALGEALQAQLSADELPAEVVVVVGGDGWMLSCVREGGEDRTYIGLNAGHLGFLLNDVRQPQDLVRASAALKEGRYPWHKEISVALPHQPSPLADKFATFLQSDKAHAVLRRSAYLPGGQ